MNIYKYLILPLLCLLCASCTSTTLDDKEEHEPEIVLSDISGTWMEYSYLNSDGYFVDVSGTGYNMYYDFEGPNKFTQYTVDETGEKEIIKQGEWVYNAETRVAHITEPQGWNLDITFDFGEMDGTYIATMRIKGKTPTSSSTIKAKRIQ